LSFGTQDSMNTEIHGCLGPFYKLALYFYVTYSVPSIKFKSSLDCLQCLTHYECCLNSSCTAEGIKTKKSLNHLNEVIQVQKAKSHMFSLICGLKT
jgi:hypothetical protein